MRKPSEPFQVMRTPKGVRMPVGLQGANDGFGWRVIADGKSAMIVGPLAKTGAEAIRKWNRFMDRLQPRKK